MKKKRTIKSDRYIVTPFKCERCTIRGEAKIDLVNSLERGGVLNIGPYARMELGKCPNPSCSEHGAMLVVPKGRYKNVKGRFVKIGGKGKPTFFSTFLGRKS